ncbi:spondin-2-like [Athalia rosae]|uniref:spondin-2-like n=1 Tax=Athalia rosae TaxID=37344 RepID=UPI002033CBA0|nr:spondin-2-like [Athalia rosae]
MRYHRVIFFFIILPTSVLYVKNVVAAAGDFAVCNTNTLAVYKLRMETHWSKEIFPKQYPTFRPPAQFSSLLGLVHNRSYVLWREGDEASPEIRTIAEKGTGVILETQKGVADIFAAPAVAQGVGSTETILYSDGKHTLVSLISKIVPSPDWFVGLDSFELCKNGRWVDNVSIHGGPFDAGTDNGFTFTAPNWRTDPSSPITRITSKEPSHPANSFYYPEIEELPSLVTFNITRERVYKAIDGAQRSVSKRRRMKFSRNNNPVVVPLGNPHLHRKPARAKRPLRKIARRPVECVMSSWSSWSACSASCGVGFETRTRTVLKPSRRNGFCSKELQQKRWCGEQSNCISKYFNW